VRILATRPGFKPARIQTKSFIFLDDVIANENMDTSVTQDTNYAARIKPGLLALPTLSLVVSAEGEAIDAVEYDEQACSLEIIWPDGQNPIQEDCGISRFGGAYTYFEKKAFSLAFRRKYGAGKLDAPLFDGFDRGTLARSSFDRLHLRGGNHDWSRSFGMSDRFIQDSYLDMGSLNPHGRYVHVYLNGEYWGQYNCKEVLNEAFLADYLGGEEDEYVSVKGNQNQGGWVIGAGDPPVVEPWELVRELRDDYEAVSPYLDVSHFIDFMLLWGFGGAENEFRACGPRTAGSGFKFWINDPDGFISDRYGVARINTATGPGYIWSGLRSEGHVDFKMLLADRIYKNFFNDGAMTGTRCTARLEARMDETRDSFLAECARWSNESGRNYSSWESSAEDAYLNYFPTWSDQLVAEWRSVGFFPSFDPPTFGQYGGSVPEGYQPTLTSSAGTIYYTLDGTDPRLPGGALHPAALVWSAGAVTVTEDITITTRVRTSGGEWSALAEPRYLLGTRTAPEAGELLITEINYNPNGPDDYEFIEIWNSGTNLIDLSGVSLSNAVRYIFPENAVLLPGAHVVVAEDSAAFAARYQAVDSPWYWADIDLSGEWIGGLSDGGETILLAASNGAAICSVSYEVDGDWPERPNGGGSSLQLADPELVPADYAAQLAYLADGNNWSASVLYHGSPGRFEEVEHSVVINEVLSHTDVGVDWIELYNTGGTAVDLGGFTLTDDMDQPTRYILPGGTSIGPYGYLTVSASVLGFGFSELGSDAALLQVDGSNTVAIIDQVEFPAAAREEPFGRHERSDGEIMFTELRAVTPGAANAAPRVGPVVISEIMYAPAAGFSPYVELINISGAA
ncbi:lamin tail domain-containing protein, partial [Pontiella sp.]|uniref:lamin tail domain-containing protein n=1 Tax=Pontiella sp. TaxID=2837462 RepID=UPI00356AD0B6